jgi:hypothetical protein
LKQKKRKKKRTRDTLDENKYNFWWLSDPNNENHYRKDNIPKKIQGMLRAENLWGA